MDPLPAPPPPLPPGGEPETGAPLNFSPALIREIFPFHVAFGRTMQIVQLGRAMEKLCGREVLGQAFASVFRIITPPLAEDFEQIRGQAFSVFFVEHRARRLKLKGQMLCSRDFPDHIVFLCSPSVQDIGALADLGLGLSDFAIHDSIIDFLLLIQTKNSDVSDVKKMAERLRHEVAIRRQAETRFRGLVENSGVGVYLLQDGRCAYVNQRFAAIFGGTVDALSGTVAVLDLVMPEDRERVAGEIDRCLDGSAPTLSFEFLGRRCDGGEVPCETFQNLTEIDGRPAIIGTLIDLTERRRAESELNIRTRAVESSYNAIVITKASKAEDNPIVYVNPAFERITGYSRDEVLGRNPRFLLGVDWEQPEIERLRNGLRSSQRTQVTLRNYRRDGTLFWNDQSTAPVKDDAGRLTHVISIINDVTERIRYEQELRHRATHDELTGLANRVLLFDRIEQAVAQAGRAGRLIAVMLLDLDRFKVINDSLGHGVGDMVVKIVAERLTACVRRGDTVARIGGDEFAVVMADLATVDDADAVARKILDVFREAIDLPARQLFVTTSIGISVAPIDGTQAEVLLKNADAAMYSAKADGGNCVGRYAARMNARAIERLTLEADLRQALERDEFLLHYQPKISVATRAVVGAEALIRWRHPRRGLVPPADFIPLAEETGLIVPIGEQALRLACRQLRQWQDAGLPPLLLAVNISAVQFRQPQLAETVRRVLAEAGVDPHRLELELTESMIMQRADAAVGTMHDLKRVGIRLAIDDFGTGYSSLAYLRRFPIDTLKIDRSFVMDLTAEQDCRTIAGTIIVLAHGLGMTTVAEGIETPEQLAILRDGGCDEIQGFLFSKPLPAEEFVRFLVAGVVFPADL